MCSGIRSVGTSTSGSGKSPSSATPAAYGSGAEACPGAARASRVCPMATRPGSSDESDRGNSFFRPSVRGLTPYQPGKPVEDVQRELGLERVVKLASNEGPFPPFPAALAAMERAAAELTRYPDGGSYRLHEALAARHGVDPAEVCVGAGADGC